MAAVFPYVLIFFSSILVDCIPVFAPPAWTIMLFVMLKFELNPWIVVSVGTAGTVCGRLIYSTFIVPWIGRKSISQAKQDDLEFVGKKLSGQPKTVFLFVFLYAVLPLSTTALFTVVGLAKVKKLYVILPFFFGNLIGDGLLLVLGRYSIRNLHDLYQGSFEIKNIVLMASGLAIMLLFLFIDWRLLLEKKKLHLKWQFWK